MAYLECHNLSKAFDGVTVLDNVSLELNEGELLVLLGSSGCGKSTLLRLIAGLEETDSGEIFISGKQVDQLRPKDRNVALVFQNYSLYPHMTVFQNIAFPLKVAKVEKQEISKRVTDVAKMLGLDERLKARPGQLSGGQRQRVALGRAIVRRPSLFLLDEPLSNLDADLRTRMRREIVSIQQKLQTTAIHVTHDQAEAMTMADRIALLNNGKIEQIGTPQEMYEQPATVFVAEFIGSPPMCLIDAVVEDDLLMPFKFPMPTGDPRFAVGSSSENLKENSKPTPRGGPPDVGSVPDNKNLKVGIRPESIHVSPDGAYSGVVEQSEYLGNAWYATMLFEGAVLRLTGSGEPPSSGALIRFDISPDDLHLFVDGVRV